MEFGVAFPSRVSDFDLVALAESLGFDQAWFFARKGWWGLGGPGGGSREVRPCGKVPGEVPREGLKAPSLALTAALTAAVASLALCEPSRLQTRKHAGR